MAREAGLQRVEAEALQLRRRWAESESVREFVKGLWRENPIFRMVLGMCPTLAVSNTVLNSLAMGAATTFAVTTSAVTVSLLRRVIPGEIRLVTYMIIIASYVTVVDLFFRAYYPAVSVALGPYVPLIITNCFVLGRCEAFASRNRPWITSLDALGVGLGFTGSLLALGVIRELLGFGSILGIPLLGDWWNPWIIMILPGGAFLTVGLFIGIIRYFSPGGIVAGHTHGG